MDTDQIGIVVLVGLFILGYALRHWYKDRAKKFLISKQVIGGSVLKIIEHNPEKPTSYIEINLALANHQKLSFGIETISKKRELTKYYFDDMALENSHLVADSNEKGHAYLVHKKSLVFKLNELGLKLYRFRFFVEVAPQKVFKSPELSFSSKGLLFKPDTGNYN